MLLKLAKPTQLDLGLLSQSPAKRIGHPLFGHTLSLSQKNNFVKVFFFFFFLIIIFICFLYLENGILKFLLNIELMVRFVDVFSVLVTGYLLSKEGKFCSRGQVNFPSSVLQAICYLFVLGFK